MESCTGALTLAATSPLRRPQQLIIRVNEKVQVSEVGMLILAAVDSEK